MTFKYSNFLFNDFSGGITDKYISVPSNEAKTLDNFLINEKGRPEIRPGYDLYIKDDGIKSSFQYPIVGMNDFNDDLIFFKNNQSYVVEELPASINTHPNKIPTPSGKFFNTTGTDSFVSFTSTGEWSDHLLVTNRGAKAGSLGIPVDYFTPMSIYRKPGGGYAAHTLGMPDYEIPYSTVATNVNPAGPDSYLYLVVYTAKYKKEPYEDADVSDMFMFGKPLQSGNLFVSEGISPSGTNVTIGTASIPLAPHSVVGENFLENYSISIYRTISGGSTFYFLDSVPYNVTLGKFVVPPLSNWNLIDNFTAQGVTYDDEITDSELITGGTFPLSNNVLSNTSSPPKCKYLTVVNNTAYYASFVERTGDNIGTLNPRAVVQSIPGTPSLVIRSSREELAEDITGIGQVNGLPIVFTKSYIYRIEGGILADGTGNMRAEVISDNIGCLSHNSIVNAGKKLFFAGENGFYFTDGYNVALMTDRLTTSYAEIAKNGSLINGSYDSLNERVYWSVRDGSNVDKETLFASEVTSVITTDSLRDATQSWATGTLIGNYVEITSGVGTGQVRRIVGNTTNTIYVDTPWTTLPVSKTEPDNYIITTALTSVYGQKMWVYNIKTSGFTKIYGINSESQQFVSVSSAEVNGVIFRGDELGYIYRHSSDYGYDIARSLTDDVADWSRSHIPFKLLTFATDFGDPAIKKWVNSSTITVKSPGKFAYAPLSVNDDSYKEALMTPVRQMNTSEWDRSDFLWKDAQVEWRKKNTISKQRRFPRKHMRCWRKQVGIIPAEVVLFSSSDFNRVAITRVTDNTNEYFLDLPTSYSSLAIDDNRFFADSIGSVGNEIVLSFDGSTNIIDAVNTWNLYTQQQFPPRNTNTVTFTGPPTSTPASGNYYLNGGISNKWPLDLIGRRVTLSEDSFDREYAILERVSDTRIKVSATTDITTIDPVVTTTDSGESVPDENESNAVSAIGVPNFTFTNRIALKMKTSIGGGGLLDSIPLYLSTLGTSGSLRLEIYSESIANPDQKLFESSTVIAIPSLPAIGFPYNDPTMYREFFFDDVTLEEDTEYFAVIVFENTVGFPKLGIGAFPANLTNTQSKHSDDGGATWQTYPAGSSHAYVGAKYKDAAEDWKIIGFNKEQVAEIQSISVKFAGLSQEGDNYQSQESGRE